MAKHKLTFSNGEVTKREREVWVQVVEYAFGLYPGSNNSEGLWELYTGTAIDDTELDIDVPEMKIKVSNGESLFVVSKFNLDMPDEEFQEGKVLHRGTSTPSWDLN